MLNRFCIDHIPNGIDTDAYQPLYTVQCRSALGIPSAKKVLMFTAAHEPLALPVYSDLTEDQQRYVVDQIREVYR